MEKENETLLRDAKRSSGARMGYQWTLIINC